MSQFVVRGAPYKAQLYLDTILDEAAKARGDDPKSARSAQISLPEILFHCLRKNNEKVFMINAATGEVITNTQILATSVSVARALVAKGVRGKPVLLVMRNHQHMMAMYFAVQFAGALPFMMDPNGTAFELNYFLKLLEPCFVFCDEEHRTNLTSSLEKSCELNAEIVVFDKQELVKKFAEGSSDNVENFTIPEAGPNFPVMLLPTSGSTGLPKPALMTNRGLVAQLPITWAYHTQFPTPTALAMLLTTAQWATFTMTVTTCVVFRVPLLVSPLPTTVDNVNDMLIKFRPTWTFFGPAFMKTLLPAITADHFSSLKTVTLLGAPTSKDLQAAVQAKLPKSAQLCDGYGTTEAQGFIAIPDIDAPVNSTGKVVNIFHYKLVDDDGNKVKLCQTGELYVKGVSTIQGYYKNNDSYNEAFEDGWFKTGDRFYIDENKRLFYVDRKKFNFKFMGSQVAPEEVEAAIGSVAGVQECMVCDTERGPAAAIVLKPGAYVSAEQIHQSVAQLSEHKRLHGGVTFVSALPHTHTGKVQRAAARAMMHDMLASGGVCV